jgi:hypothetical protein
MPLTGTDCWGLSPVGWQGRSGQQLTGLSQGRPTVAPGGAPHLHPQPVYVVVETSLSSGCMKACSKAV